MNAHYYYFGCFYSAFFLKRTNFFYENYNQMGKRHARIGHNALRFELTIKTASRYRRFSPSSVNQAEQGFSLVQRTRTGINRTNQTP